MGALAQVQRTRAMVTAMAMVIRAAEAPRPGDTGADGAEEPRGRAGVLRAVRLSDQEATAELCPSRVG